MKIPYGQSNFVAIREEGAVYVDKTRFIEVLENENASYQFFVRPRRFGKDRLIESFDECVRSEARRFESDYRSAFRPRAITRRQIDALGADSLVRELARAADEAGQKMMVLIDEYDNFANDLIGTGNRALYEDLMHGEGYVRTFYKALKEGTRSCIERIFITGVSPFMLDDLTSGFNITRNLTGDRRLNEMMGFTGAELEYVIDAVGADRVVAKNELLADMRRYYNGYLFHGQAKERLYNSDMVLSFLDQLITQGDYPESILDDNVKVDYRRIRELAFNFKDEELLDRLLAEETITSQLATRFNLESMYDTRENFVSILFYMGLLTIESSEAGWIRFRIPNYVIRTVYWEYLKSRVEKAVEIRSEELRRAVESMRTEGQIEAFGRYVATVLEKLSNRDLIRYDEKHLKAIVLTLLHVEGLYLIESEYEAERGYVDIVLTADRRYEQWIRYEWVIELKYLPEGERHRLEETQADARSQLQRYVGEKLRGRIAPERLRTATMVVVGKSDVVVQGW